MFTKTQLITIQNLVAEAFSSRKGTGKEIAKKEYAVYSKLMEINGKEGNSRSYTKGGVKGNEYIDGTYRLWKQPNGSIGLKLDKQNELYNLPKEDDLYKRIDYLFEMYGEMEWEKSQEQNIEE